MVYSYVFLFLFQIQCILYLFLRTLLNFLYKLYCFCLFCNL
nr:MAG TPA: hypothetical protein [Caudoviricetes sp.]